MVQRPRSMTGRVLLVLVLVVGAVVAVLWALQRHLIYFPDSTPVPSAATVIAGARDVTLRTADGLELGAWFVPADPRQDTGMAVLLAPGNGGNRAGRAGLAEELRRRGLAVLVMDYRGYGGNPGSPSERGLAADADAAVDALTGQPSCRPCRPDGHPRAWCFARRSPTSPTWAVTTTRGFPCAYCFATGSRSWTTLRSVTCR
jgi:hypothetical protein